MRGRYRAPASIWAHHHSSGNDTANLNFTLLQALLGFAESGKGITILAGCQWSL